MLLYFQPKCSGHHVQMSMNAPWEFVNKDVQTYGALIAAIVDQGIGQPQMVTVFIKEKNIPDLNILIDIYYSTKKRISPNFQAELATMLMNARNTEEKVV